MINHTKTSSSNKVILEPRDPIGSVIWLHGLGADGNDFLAIVNELNLPEHLPLRFIFPHAPMRPVTINQNQVMRAWFDIYSLTSDHALDHQGMGDSSQLITDLIHQENQLHIPTEKIIIGGFSQGAMLALTSALSYPEKLAGVIALSGCLLNAQKVLQNMTANTQLPIFIAHGIEDPVLPSHLGEQTANVLKSQGLPIDFHLYPMGHSVCLPEINDLRQWLIQVIQK